MSADDEALIEALKAAGHQDVAKHLADRQLAGTLREAGHPELADALAAKGAGASQPTSEPAPAVSAEDRESQEFIADLKAAADSGWTSTRGLI